MAVTFVRATTSLTTPFSHVVDNYSDRILLVAINWFDNGAGRPTVVTYAGLGMTKLSEQIGPTNRVVLQLWYLISPPIGTANVVVTASGGGLGGAAAITYAGVDQTTPFGTAVGAQNTGTAVTVTVTSELGQLVFDMIGTCNVSSGPTFTQTAPQVKEVDLQGGGGTAWSHLGTSDKPGASSVVMAWTLGASSAWAQIAVPMRQSVAPRGRAVAYVLDAWDPQRRILSADGRELAPWQVDPDNWIRITGVNPPTSEAPASLIDDPECAYIESKTYQDDGGSLSLPASRGDLPEIVLARAATKGTG